MNFLLPLASLLGIEVEAVADRAKSMVLIYSAIALLLLVSVAFMIAAGYMLLAQSVGPIIAALIFAGTFFVLGLAVYLGAQIGEGRRRRVAAERRKSSETGALLTSAALTALPAVLRAPGILRLGVPAAAIAAFLLLRNKDGDS